MSNRTLMGAIVAVTLGATLVIPDITVSLAAPVGGLVHLREATGHYYVWIGNPLKWNQARDFAGKYSTKFDGVALDQWHLATITDAAENAFVFDVVLTPGATSAGEASFLGAIVSDGSLRNFKWVTGEPFIYTNFAPGQPDFARENVLEMGGTWGARWNDQDGPGSPGEERRPFILEHEPVCFETSVTVTTIPDVSVSK